MFKIEKNKKLSFATQFFISSYGKSSITKKSASKDEGNFSVD